MRRPIRVSLTFLLAVASATVMAACGTEKISVAQNDPTHAGAVLFSQRCSGCHTLAYAAANGSAANPRSAQANNGPNFNVRCERPIARVLYAIENGGFSGAIMPQNIVVGKDAKAVAGFVSEYAGRQAPKIVGQVPCVSQPVGSLPAPNESAQTAIHSSAGIGQSTNSPQSQRAVKGTSGTGGNGSGSGSHSARKPAKHK